ncbi:hypothetical protein HMPREF9306_00255 [Propionimicrobium lymphophilum ACS-093-V-SCH5]|uniref:Uncharacterized protein n=1 Tax=Propionimicrobium lymphophilum ACS-093-V-SCH5 TaxID=883161 RepID=S2W6G7_9ACTN|nr:hypothetical protein HMPREF9306_00255 [Propionimicrobium lymphophilum ACS-093-V-SCH5]
MRVELPETGVLLAGRVPTVLVLRLFKMRRLPSVPMAKAWSLSRMNQNRTIILFLLVMLPRKSGGFRSELDPERFIRPGGRNF